MRSLPAAALALTVALAVGLGASPRTAAQDGDAPPPPAPTDRVAFSYHDYSRSMDAARALERVADGRFARVERIGRSSLGRELVALVITDRSKKPGPEFRPGLLAVGNLRGDEALGGEVALTLARTLVARAAAGDPEVLAILGRCTVYVVPRPNPDGTELLFGRPARAEPFVLAPGRDDDRDHRRDEDPPDDLDRDGLILRMRVAGHEAADHLVELSGAPDGDDRLVRAADSAGGERGTHALLAEGRDDDGDLDDNEDGEWGIDLDRSFPIGWKPAHQSPGAGRFPLEAPEAKALADFVLSQRNIAAAVVWSTVGPRGGPRPVASGEVKPEGDDAKLYEAWKKRYADVTGGEKAPDPFHAPKEAKAPGSFQDWLYGGLGVFSWSIRLFDAPPERAGETDAEKKLPLGRRWLAWDDATRGGAGFVPWKPFRHPRYERVEIGGWRPLEGANPPESIGAEIAQRQQKFAIALARALPHVRIAEVSVEPLEGDLYQVEVIVENAGDLPLPTRMGARARRGVPTVLQAAPGGGDQLVLGKARHVVGRLAAAGGRDRVAFVMRAAKGGKAPLRLLLSSPRGGVDGKEIWVGKEF